MDAKEMGSMGQAAMRRKQSQAEKLFWPLKAGRSREFSPGLIEAVHTGREIADRLYGAVIEAGLDLGHAECYLVSVKDGDILLGLFRTVDKDASDLEVANAIWQNRAEPVGVVFTLDDQEKEKLLAHGRVFNRENEGPIVSALSILESRYRSNPERVAVWG